VDFLDAQILVINLLFRNFIQNRDSTLKRKKFRESELFEELSAYETII
jgi:hypothetical protein